MKRQAIYSINSHYPVEVQKMINEATHCLTCGKKLSYLPSKDGRRNRGYCSSSCLSANPPKMAYIQKLHGKSARNVILEMLNNGASLATTAALLGVNRQALYAWLSKLDIKKKVVWG